MDKRHGITTLPTIFLSPTKLGGGAHAQDLATGKTLAWIEYWNYGDACPIAWLPREKRYHGWNLIGWQEYDRDIDRREILLVFEVLVGGDKNIEIDRGEPKQVAVLDAGPAYFLNCGDAASRQAPLISYGVMNFAIKKAAAAANPPTSVVCNAPRTG